MFAIVIISVRRDGMIVMILSITVACGLSMAWARLIMMVMMIMIIMTIMFIILLTAPSSARARHGMGKVDNDDYDDNDGHDDDDDDDDDNEYDLAHLPSSARARHGRGSHRRNGASHSSTGSSLLLQHRPVERVVVLVVQCPEQDPEIKSFEKDQK